MPGGGKTYPKPAVGSAAFVEETFQRFTFDGSQWNDTTVGDLPTGGDTLTWDGNTEGLESVHAGDGIYFYLISTQQPPVDSYSYTFGAGGETQTITSDQFPAQEGAPGFWGCAYGYLFIITDEAVGVEIDGFGFNKAGIYARQGTDEVTFDYFSLTIPGYTGFPSVKKLDEKYLPDDVGGVSSWNDLTDKPFRVASYFGELTIEMFSYSDLIIVNQAGGSGGDVSGDTVDDAYEYPLLIATGRQERAEKYFSMWGRKGSSWQGSINMGNGTIYLTKNTTA